MKITNKITKRDVSSEYLGLMLGLITNEEFEEVTCTPPISSNAEKYIENPSYKKTK